MALGYVFIACALAVGLVKGYCGKCSSGLITTYRGSMLFGLVRMVLCVLVGFIIMLVNGSLTYIGALNWQTLLFASLAGIGQAGMIVTWLVSARRGSLVMLEVFNLLGTILSVLCCFFFFGESVSIWQGIAMAMLLVATYLTVGYNVALKGKMTLSSFVTLIIGAVTTGLSTFAQKGLKFFNPSAEAELLRFYTFVFNFYTYVAAAIVLIVAYGITSYSGGYTKKDDEPTPAHQVFRPRPLIYVTVMATCLFAHSLFQTLAGSVGQLDAVRIYPLTQGCGMILTMLMAALLFGERINKRSLFAILLAIGALVMMQVL